MKLAKYACSLDKTSQIAPAPREKKLAKFNKRRYYNYILSFVLPIPYIIAIMNRH